jgi:hypothetical protein
MKAEAPLIVNDMLASESKSFYTIKEGLLISTISQLKHRQNSGQDSFIILNNIRESKSVE